MQRIIVDTDGGIDDALALLYVLASPNVSVEAITAVHGNVPVDQVVRNILEVLRVSGTRNVPPVVTGAAAPLAGPPVTATEIHGSDGLGGWMQGRPAAAFAESGIPASRLIPQIARKYPGEVTLVTLGPMTNVALAQREDLDGLRLLKEIVSMAGTVWSPGNISAVAEFNVYADPEAAREVLHSGISIVLVGLDVSTKAVLTPESLKNAPSFVTHICNHLFSVYRERTGSSGFALHDPLAAAVALDRSLIELRPMNVDVETRGEITRGYLAAEQRPWIRSAPNAGVCVNVDAARFLETFRSRVIVPATA